MKDIYHASFDCRDIIESWKQYLPWPLSVLNTRSLLEVFQSILAKGSSEALARVVTIAWGLWLRRNKMIFDGKAMHPVEAINNVLSLQTDYKVTKDINHKPSLGRQLWIPLKMGSLKLNTNGAIFPEQYKAGIGYVLRDDQGQVCMAAKIRRCISTTF